MIFNALGGGTGSGLGCLIQEYLSVEYPKKCKLGFAIYPSPNISTGVVEPYNAMLAMHSILEHQDVTVVLDNESMYNICKKYLKIERPTYSNLNRQIAQIISSLTASMRFNGALNVNIREMKQNLVPYPRIHFMLSSYSPFVSSE